MSNMSYCRFRNTLSNLRDCVENLEDILDLEDDKKNDEREAAEKMLELCMEIAEDYGHLLEEKFK